MNTGFDCAILRPSDNPYMECPCVTIIYLKEFTGLSVLSSLCHCKISILVRCIVISNVFCCYFIVFKAVSFAVLILIPSAISVTLCCGV